MFCVVNPGFETLINTRMLRQKETNITALPIKPVMDFEIAFLPKPIIKKPRKGKRGIK